MAFGCLTFWGVSASGVLASPSTGLELYLTPGGAQYVVSERGNLWAGNGFKKPQDIDRMRRTGLPKIKSETQWKGPGFLAVTIETEFSRWWLVGGSLMIPSLASAILSAGCFLAYRRVRLKYRDAHLTGTDTPPQ